MHITVFILIFFLFPLAVTAAESSTPSVKMTENNAPPQDVDQHASKEPVYFCPMHPHIHGEKGDSCPICGMKLVPQTQTGNDRQDKGDALYIEPVYRHALGVKTATASRHEFGKTIHAFGHVAPSTRMEHSIATRTAGWIVDLNTNAVGDTVRKGDLLFTFYSPDLMTAQSDYLIGRRVGNAERRLRLYGMDEQAIAELKKKGRFLEETPFYAPADGTVSMLNVRKGAYAEQGDMVLALQDYSQVWVQAHLPLRDMQFLTVGTPATVTIDETGEFFRAPVDFIYPMTDPQSRNGLVRLLLDNPDGKLKTGALVNVVFEADSQPRLAVPAEAVLYGKDGGHVIEALGDGYFRPVSVRTGITAHGMTEIVSGLKEGEKIVTSGQFMIDAESSLSGGMANMAGMDMPEIDGANQNDHENMNGMQDMETGNGHRH